MRTNHFPLPLNPLFNWSFFPNSKTSHDRQIFLNVMIPQNLTVFLRSSPRVRVKLKVSMTFSAVTMIRSSKCGEAYLADYWTACLLQERNGVGYAG
jgi:hypothetical protein